MSEVKTYCKNCSAELIGKYCHECGQAAADPRKTLLQIISTLFSALINWDGKFLKTLRWLFFKPGHLTVLYLQGKRQSFQDPLRLFLFSSFVFFFLLIFQFNKLEQKAKPLNFYSLNDTTVVLNMPGFTDTLYGYTIRNEQIENINSQEKDIVISKHLLPDFIQRFKSNISYLFWITLPFFALLLKLLYWPSKIFYWDHLIFSYHFYAFIFLVSSLTILLQIILLKIHAYPEDLYEWFILLIIILAWIYSFVAQKKVYQESWGKTFVKNVLLGFLFYLLILPFITIIYILYIYRDKLAA
ncbi:MAG: DUF3667 domain-containing protein [Flavobacteriales bacterium]|nr:DUF3667 domain-containing protein [Flavobacteriales bacterium]